MRKIKWFTDGSRAKIIFQFLDTPFSNQKIDKLSWNSGSEIALFIQILFQKYM